MPTRQNVFTGRRALGHGFDIPTRREGTPGPREDQHLALRVIAHLTNRRPDLGAHRFTEGVQRLRPVEGDARNPLPLFQDDVVKCHTGRPFIYRSAPLTRRKAGLVAADTNPAL
jgi:hypothetical protein